MSSICTSYNSGERGFVKGFSCPTADSNIRAVFCCGFNDMKYCCDDPNSFFPYEYGYMWWLSFGALVGLSIAAVVLLVFVITVCVLCYLFIVTKPSSRDDGLNLSVPGSDPTSEPSLLLDIRVSNISLTANWSVKTVPLTLSGSFSAALPQLSPESMWKDPHKEPFTLCTANGNSVEVYGFD